MRKGAQAGIAAVAIRISHHFAAACPDIEPFAAEGFIALAMVNGRQRMVVRGGNRKLLGTSPMAFAARALQYGSSTQALDYRAPREFRKQVVNSATENALGSRPPICRSVS